MHWRIRITAVLAMVVSLLSVSAQAAETLYAATGSGGVAGNLYVVDPNSGASFIAGPILLNGATPIALTGLAVHPQTGVIYGTTASADATIPRHLVRLTPNGTATDIGNLGANSADIAFTPGGVLYMTSGGATSLFVVNLGSGAATAVGPTGFGNSGAGLAITANNIGLMAGNGASAVLAVLNLNTGAGTAGPVLNGAPIPGGTINSASFNSAGVLFAVNGNFGGGVGNLVTINPATGAVTNIGTLPPDIDALAFATLGEGVPTMSEWAMILMALLLAVTGFFAMRRRG